MSRQFPSTPIEFLCWIRVPRIWSDLITAFQEVASASDFVMVQCWICCGVTRGFVAGPWSRISWLVVAKWNPWSSRSSRDHLGAVIIGDQAAIWSSLINDCHSWLKVSSHHEYNLLKPLLSPKKVRPMSHNFNLIFDESQWFCVIFDIDTKGKYILKRRVKPCLALKMRGRTCEVENSCGTLSEEAANHSQPSLNQRHGRHRA